MLLTPVGAIKLFVNGKEIPFTAIKLNNSDLHCPDVNGRFLIQYEYKNEFKKQKIKCCIPSLDVQGDPEGGERIEAISIYKNDLKLTIMVVGEFEDYPEHLDYTGEYLSNGIQYETFQSTENQTFRFGICWIQPCTEENDFQTWFGADPTLMP